MWDGIVEIAAQTVEKGGTIAQAVANAIERMRAMKPDATAEHDRAVAEHVTALYNEATGKNEKVAPPAATKPDKQPDKEFTEGTHAATEAAREKLNLPERIKNEKETNEQRGKEAAAAVAADKDLPNKLVDRVLNAKKGSTTLNATEQIVLTHFIKTLNDEAEKIARQYYAALEGATPDKATSVRLLAAYAAKENAINLALKVAGKGSLLTDACRARQLLATDEFSIERIVRDKRMANGGKKISDEQANWVRDQHAKLKKLTSDYDATLKEDGDESNQGPLRLSKKTLAAKEAYDSQVAEYKQALQTDKTALRFWLDDFNLLCGAIIVIVVGLGISLLFGFQDASLLLAAMTGFGVLWLGIWIARRFWERTAQPSLIRAYKLLRVIFLRSFQRDVGSKLVIVYALFVVGSLFFAPWEGWQTPYDKKWENPRITRYGPIFSPPESLRVSPRLKSEEIILVWGALGIAAFAGVYLSKGRKSDSAIHPHVQ